MLSTVAVCELALRQSTWDCGQNKAKPPNTFFQENNSTGLCQREGLIFHVTLQEAHIRATKKKDWRIRLPTMSCSQDFVSIYRHTFPLTMSDINQTKCHLCFWPAAWFNRPQWHLNVYSSLYRRELRQGGAVVNMFAFCNSWILIKHMWGQYKCFAISTRGQPSQEISVYRNVLGMNLMK